MSIILRFDALGAFKQETSPRNVLCGQAPRGQIRGDGQACPPVPRGYRAMLVLWCWPRGELGLLRCNERHTGWVSDPTQVTEAPVLEAARRSVLLAISCPTHASQTLPGAQRHRGERNNGSARGMSTTDLSRNVCTSPPSRISPLEEAGPGSWPGSLVSRGHACFHTPASRWPAHTFRPSGLGAP